MLKSNSKQVKEYFKSAIIVSLETEELDDFIGQFNDLSLNDINFEYNNNIVEFIANYHAGHGMITPEYRLMRQDLKMAFDMTDTEINRLDDYEVSQKYFTLLHRALFEVFQIGTAPTLNRAGKMVQIYFWKC